MKTPENANELLRANSSIGRLKAVMEPRHWSPFLEWVLVSSLKAGQHHPPSMADMQALAEIFTDQLRTKAIADLEEYTDDLEIRDYIVWNIARLDLAIECFEGLPFISEVEGDGEE